jgi:O-antigen/teichoic acid export membrane protein
LQIHGELLVRNTILSFAGQAIPAVLTLVTIPFVIRGLGAERFGILALAWAVLGYFTVFDLVGRATIKFVAEYLGRGELEAIPRIIWTSLGLQTSLGIVGAVVLAAGSSLLVTRGLKISLALTHESQQTFRILAAALPVVIGSRNLRGVLEARQRFDLVAMVQLPTSSAVSLMPALGILSGFHLPGIMLLIFFCWVANAIAYVALCFRMFPAMRQCSIDRQMIRPLLSYGGWIAICNILLAIIGSLDRFLIGILISVQALAYYAPPAEMVFRLMIIPSVLGMTLFPAFCTLSTADPSHLERLYARSLKYVVLLIGPTIAIAAVFADDIISLWLGREFALRSTAVFQLLLGGMFLTAIGHMPANLLDGIGRPDLRAKAFFVCIAVYVPLVCVLTSRIGIVGTALAWTIKAALELSIFLLQLRKVLPLRTSALKTAGFTRTIAALAALLSVTVAIKIAGPMMWIQLAAIVMGLLTFATIAWRYALDGSDRNGLGAILTWGRRAESRTIQLSPVP